MQRAGPVSGHWPSRSSIPRPTSPRSCSRSLASPRSWSVAAFWSAPRAAGRCQSQRRQKRPVSASKLAKRSAASPAAIMSARVRFRGSNIHKECPLTPNVPRQSALERRGGRHLYIIIPGNTGSSCSDGSMLPTTSASRADCLSSIIRLQSVAAII
jgi:hypothetical protein